MMQKKTYVFTLGFQTRSDTNQQTRNLDKQFNDTDVTLKLQDSFLGVDYGLYLQNHY